MISKDKLTKYSQVVVLISISTALILWRYVQVAIPTITIETTLGVFVAILTSMFLYFDSRLSTALRDPGQTITPMNLSDCFNQLSRSCRHIKHIRIYALSTGRIHPLFSSSNLHVETCDILLRDFSSAELQQRKSLDYQRHINDMVSEWKKEEAKGRVRTLHIGRFYFMPTEYYIIIDDKVMIAGLFLPTADNWGDVIDPVYVQNSSSVGAQLITQYSRRFDQLKKMLDNKSK